ncbi:helix-turn-helix transcriptional regulator [Actinomadura alba]|uniref:Helix-turn-helix domain-containing protein n=1 Tax=Actinomadura alba TaxID=406431 RepID=A0ABR7M0E8_9ACTN|nr:helix-turn-helix transcriptional regulator [Actinomadura alba]MBC6470581.1 helix-turn-helix domain-containing protein [Actinomadura alba]
MGHVENEITPFLKARRAALDPAELGLPEGVARRRVRGLRREEVAQLAGVSVDYYTRIEQGRAPAISDSVLDAVARALRLTPVEHAYLRNITLPRRRAGDGALVCTEGTEARPRVRPEIQELLDAMDDTVPAIVYGPATDMLAWNRIAGRLSFDFDALPETELNAAWLIFLHPGARALYPAWEEMAEETVASLRAEIGRHPDQARVHRVICELRERSEEFRRYWEAQGVLDRNHGTKRILNPEVGELVLTYEAFPLPNDAGQRLCTFTAPKGSETERRLRALTERVGASVA